jgi:hypothetical protein
VEVKKHENGEWVITRYAEGDQGRLDPFLPQSLIESFDRKKRLAGGIEALDRGKTYQLPATEDLISLLTWWAVTDPASLRDDLPGSIFSRLERAPRGGFQVWLERASGRYVRD